MIRRNLIASRKTGRSSGALKHLRWSCPDYQSIDEEAVEVIVIPCGQASSPEKAYRGSSRKECKQARKSRENKIITNQESLTSKTTS